MGAVSGFRGPITDYQISPNGKYLGVSSSTKDFRVYFLESVFEGKTQFFFKKCERHYPSAISVTNKGKICVIAIEEENTLEFFKLYPKGKPNHNGKMEFLVSEKRFQKDLHKTTITKVRYNEEIDVAVTFA